ncbi:hypothetical protein GCK32_008344 [Trichostrongylus colubriformis]|uniref:Uncharacterized protein n=1 Tax=Trichostrongylus colubriformis TaxID=6319 RepID=A0AAN8INW5_TRICO
MPESVYDKYNGSSSEEEEESDEEVVLPRRTQQFRVASNPTEAKAEVLNEIRELAGQQQRIMEPVKEPRHNVVKQPVKAIVLLSFPASYSTWISCSLIARQAAALQQAAAARAAAPASPAANANQNKV